ncbi:hypothetical protein BP422_12220 [Brevibacillus formosus]|uniref:Uncharacterized protein n=1 Tax=Brevibacillus formosus TaxID=54913 RepID=A0A220MGY6_9BACL|nr:hypothetical protein [Brevibacillus formosus]ASJ54245.1 hypothetical protein BP422_12220 [Brevibacillus formosus]
MDFALCILATLLVGCLPTDEKVKEKHQDPDIVLNQYFDALSKQDYDAKVKLYGGDYESLIGNNPSITEISPGASSETIESESFNQRGKLNDHYSVSEE